MAVQPFTSAGVALKLTELYALSDTLLLVEAKKAATDVLTWLTANFIIDTEMNDYLATAPEKALFFWGVTLSAGLVTRGDINMTNRPTNNPPRRTKELKENMRSSITYNNFDLDLDGTFDIDIDWALLP